MRRGIWLFLAVSVLLLACVAELRAQVTPGSQTGGGPVNPYYVIPGANKPLGDQQISAATLASSTALTVPTGATMAIIQVEAASVRFRDSGSAPTASVGLVLSPGNTLQLSGAVELAAVRFILQSGSPILDVSYYK